MLLLWHIPCFEYEWESMWDDRETERERKSTKESRLAQACEWKMNRLEKEPNKCGSLIKPIRVLPSDRTTMSHANDISTKLYYFFLVVILCSYNVFLIASDLDTTFLSKKNAKCDYPKRNYNSIAFYYNSFSTNSRFSLTSIPMQACNMCALVWWHAIAWLFCLFVFRCIWKIQKIKITIWKIQSWNLIPTEKSSTPKNLQRFLWSG